MESRGLDPVLGTWTAASLQPGSWPPELELALLDAVSLHKPVGVHAHFRMAAIYSKMQRCVPDITAAALWEQLATLYDFSELEDSSAEDLLGDGATGGAFELPKTKGWYAAEMSARGILPDGDVSKASRKHDGTKSKTSTRGSDRKRKR